MTDTPDPVPHEPGPHDHGPHRSDDPTWTDTWYWNGIDPGTGAVFWAHVSWLPARGTGQHVVTSLVGGRPQRRRVDTTQPFSSDLLQVDIVEPWALARLRCAPLGIDVEWAAFSDPVDFHGHLRVNEDIQLSHFQGGGRSVGVVEGQAFGGHGLRDRSFGPRNLRRIGRNWAIAAIGIEQDSFLTANVMWPDTATFAEGPSVTFGCLWRDGAPVHYDGGIVAHRRRDASPGAVLLPGGPTVELDLAERYGETWLVLDPGSSPTDDLSDQPAYEMRSIYVPVSSPELGPLVGWYTEGILWVN